MYQKLNDAQTIAESFCSAPVTPVYSEDESVFNWNVTQSKPNENDENKTSQEADRCVVFNLWKRNSRHRHATEKKLPSKSEKNSCVKMMAPPQNKPSSNRFPTNLCPITKVKATVGYCPLRHLTITSATTFFLNQERKLFVIPIIPQPDQTAQAVIAQAMKS